MFYLFAMDASYFPHGPCFVLLTVLLALFDTSQSVPPEYCLHSLNTSDCNGPPTAVAYYYKSGSRCEIAIWRGCPTLNKFSDEVICSHFCIGKIIRWGSEEKQDIEEWKQEIELVPSQEVEFMDAILDNMNKDTKPHRQKLHLDIMTEKSSTLSEKTTKINTVGTTSPETDSTIGEVTTTETTTAAAKEVTTTAAAEEVTTTAAAEEETTTAVAEEVTTTVAAEEETTTAATEEVTTTVAAEEETTTNETPEIEEVETP